MDPKLSDIHKEIRRMRIALIMLSMVVTLLGVAIILLFQTRQILTSTAMPSTPSLPEVKHPDLTTYALPSLPIPDSISLAGEAIPLSLTDIRERYEFELLVTVYRQSATIVGLKRAARWFPIIEPILKSQGIPDDFKYLCVVESNLANAISPSKAVGFWQFLEGTAIQYGLEVNKNVDERYHVEKATIAASKYLKDAYKKFGNWTLAAASYNMGMTGLQDQISQQEENDYYKLKLNVETSRYILRIAVTKELFEHPEQYGFNLSKEELYAPYKTRKLLIQYNIPDLVSFAKEQGSSFYMLKELNPWLRSNQLYLSPQKAYEILLPINDENAAHR